MSRIIIIIKLKKMNYLSWKICTIFFQSMMMWNWKTKLKKEKLVSVVKHSKVVMKIKIQKQKTYHKKTTYV